VYKRLTPLPKHKSFADLVLATWAQENNQLGTDFELYSSVVDARKGVNKWSFCNYDDNGVGFPRDCGVSGQTSFQWNTLAAAKEVNTSAKEVVFCAALNL
jgi:hypothetical protein